MSMAESDVFGTLEPSWREQCAVAFLVLWQIFGIFPVGRWGVLIYPLLNLLAVAILLYFIFGLFGRGLSTRRRAARGGIVTATLFLLLLIFVPRFAEVWSRFEHAKTTLIRPVVSIFRLGDARPQLLLSRDCGAYYRCTLIFNPSDKDPCDSELLESANFSREGDLEDFALAAPLPTVPIADHYCSAIYKSKYIPWHDASS